MHICSSDVLQVRLIFVDLRGTGTDCNSALTTENANKMCIVFVTLKYLLFVHSSKYGVIYSSSRFCSRLP